ncbi:MAG: hypothetical protein ACYS8Z_00630 [Planctomycetota bacterium]|jgi:chromosome segregation ATPase
MDYRKKIAARAGMVQIALILATFAFITSGCGNKMARVEENQLRLQALVEMNAQQIGKVAHRIEENQQTLQEAIESVRSSTQRLAGDIASVVGEHVELQKSVRAADAAITGKITDIEDKQGNLHSLAVASAADIAALQSSHTKLQEKAKKDDQDLTKKITAVEIDQDRLQTEIENAQAGVARVAASLNAVADAHAKLEEVAKIDGERTATRISQIDQEQIAQQNEIQSMGSNVRKIVADIAALEENLGKLQEVLQNDAQNLADVVDIIRQRQTGFEGKIAKDFRELADFVRTIEQNQAKLAEQASSIQKSTQTMISDMSAAMDGLKTRTSSSEPPKVPKVAKTKSAPSEEEKK